MLGSHDGRAKYHEQAGHYNEYRQHCKKDCLNKADRHIGTKLELHACHCRHTAYGGKRAAEHLGNCVGESLYNRLTKGKTLVLISESVNKNNRIVQRQRQLKKAGYRVGYEGNLAEYEVCTHVDYHRRNEGKHDYGNFDPGS